jgi:hypothetical protein
MNFNNGGFIHQNGRVSDIYGNVHFTAFNFIPKTGNPDHPPTSSLSQPKVNMDVAGGALAEEYGGPHTIFGKTSPWNGEWGPQSTNLQSRRSSVY